MLTLSNPVHPSRARLDAEANAIQRDLRDAHRLSAVQCVIGTTLDAMVPIAGEALEHPYAEFSIDSVVSQLHEWLDDIRLELERLRGPTVIEEADYDDA